MFDEGTDPNLSATTEPPAEESSNRTFLIGVGILGGLVFLTIVCALIYIFAIAPRLAAGRPDELATVEAHNALINAAMTATAEALTWTETPLPSPIPTETATATLVVAMPSETATSLYDPLTATLAALYTQAYYSALTPTSTLTAPEGLPKGGFADEFGIPGLLIMAAVLVAVIFLARRLRTAPARQE